MYLLNTKSLTLKYFHDNSGLDYAILSNTWTDDEIIFDDFVDGHTKDENVRRKTSYPKVCGACRQAASDEYEWIWIDTMCINKTSSAELQEAINSMFNWYKRARTCYAYLEDVPNEKEGWIKDIFQKSRWFTRGWTLQELIAPFHVTFFSADWKPIGTKLQRMSEVHEVTGIAKIALQTRNMANHHVAEIMSWAAHREVTREEDTAYSLMGLFDINVPMLYGEGGTKAFLRLQEAIYKFWTDDTLFLWTYAPYWQLPSILAEHPRQFCRVNDCGKCDLYGPQICFPRSIQYKEIRPIKRPPSRMANPYPGPELLLRRRQVQVNMVILGREDLANNSSPNVVTVYSDLSGGVKDRELQAASVFAVLDVTDNDGHLYCLAVFSAYRSSTFQRLLVLGLLPLTVNLPGRIPINFHTYSNSISIRQLTIEFESDHFAIESLRPSLAMEANVQNLTDRKGILLWGHTGNLECTLIANDPSIRSRQIVIELAQSDLDNRNGAADTSDIGINSVTVRNRGKIEHSSPVTLFTDQYSLRLTDGSTVLTRVRYFPYSPGKLSSISRATAFRCLIQMTRSGPGNESATFDKIMPTKNRLSRIRRFDMLFSRRQSEKAERLWHYESQRQPCCRVHITAFPKLYKDKKLGRWYQFDISRISLT